MCKKYESEIRAARWRSFINAALEKAKNLVNALAFNPIPSKNSIYSFKPLSVAHRGALTRPMDYSSNFS